MQHRSLNLPKHASRVFPPPDRHQNYFRPGLKKISGQKFRKNREKTFKPLHQLALPLRFCVPHTCQLIQERCSKIWIIYQLIDLLYRQTTWVSFRQSQRNFSTNSPPIEPLIGHNRKLTRLVDIKVSEHILYNHGK